MRPTVDKVQRTQRENSVKPNFHYSDTTRHDLSVTSPRTCWRRRQLVGDKLVTCYGLVITDKSLTCWQPVQWAFPHVTWRH